ncbi:MAG: virulence RhuM family protein [Lachnospiraceae bacterium]|jgi:hypothetical protein|nr:virulence RhuM family protein [Lachnospiraceae bacterium]
MTIDSISKLYGKGRSTISEHLKSIFIDGELYEDSVCRNYRHTASDGKSYKTKYYSLEAIISVGYRVKSSEAIHFRQWSTRVLKAYTTKDYLLDKERIENDKISAVNY